MEKVFCLGLLFGMVGGALIVANSYKARSLVKKSQSEIMERVDEKMDECLKQMEQKEGGKENGKKEKKSEK